MDTINTKSEPAAVVCADGENLLPVLAAADWVGEGSEGNPYSATVGGKSYSLSRRRSFWVLTCHEVGVVSDPGAPKQERMLTGTQAAFLLAA